MTARVAILDDQTRVAEILAMVLRGEGYHVETFAEPAACLAALAEQPVDLLLTDLKMPGMDGVEVLRRARAQDESLPVILVTAHATVQTAIAAMKEGAFDYVEKPVDNQACKALVRRALEHTRLSRENRYLREELRGRYALDRLIAVSPAMHAVIDLARRAAKSRATVLITGESGTGKEIIARAVHYYSDRVGQPFIAVNCKAFAEGVLESELFGHAKGAFTGAAAARAGIFERANGGTLFLDEIGEVDPGFQAKLLRVLQEREVLRVGDNVARPVDVRVLAATNRSLEADVAAGRFREDLYFRLAVIPIAIPPLRERPEDIVPLARQFLLSFAHELDKPLTGWSPEVASFMVSHDWPGNVRELENTMERAAVLARGTTIEVEDLLLTKRSAAPMAGSRGDSLAETLDQRAAEHIREVLAECRGVRADAAKRLGVDRTTLYRLMKKYGLEGPGGAP